jgi:diacylglycerol kinase
VTKIGFIKSAFCAIKGLIKLIAGERNIIIQMLASSITVLFMYLLKIPKLYSLVIAGVFFLGIVLELFNTNIERLIDIISPEYNKEFGKIKDSMAGVVLLLFIVPVIFSMFILWVPVMNFCMSLSKNVFSVFLMIANIILILITLLAIYIKNKN